MDFEELLENLEDHDETRRLCPNTQTYFHSIGLHWNGGKKRKKKKLSTDELSVAISKFVLSTFWEIKIILFQELHFAWPMGLAPIYQLFCKSIMTTGWTLRHLINMHKPCWQLSSFSANQLRLQGDCHATYLLFISHSDNLPAFNCKHCIKTNIQKTYSKHKIQS